MSIGNKIGRYEIKKLLGKGGMGEVFLAYDTSLERDVAIKVLLPEFCSNIERINRFKLEAKAASALNHPNIITIYEIDNDDDKLFICNEFIKGETLRSLIERNALELSSSLNIAEQVASALTSAHQAGIIHRDIKPENIMIREDGIVKVLDFGLAKPTLVESEAETRELVSTKAGVVMGSIGYMSPEQSRGKEVDNRTDLWSLGVVLYEMLTGKTPFDGETMTDILANIIHKEPLPIGEKISNCPIELSRIIKKSLRKDREERYQTAKDFQIDLKNLRREMELEHELELTISPNKLNEIRTQSNEVTKKSISKKTTNENTETQVLSNAVITEHSKEIVNHKQPKRKVSMAMFAVLGIAFLGGLWALSNNYWQNKTKNLFENSKITTLSENNDLSDLSISPDGKYLAYSQSKKVKNPKLMLRQIETGSENEIAEIGENNVGGLVFSPDVNYLYYLSQEKGGITANLYRVPTLGGEPKKILSNVGSAVSFRPDGKSFIFTRISLTPSNYKVIETDKDGGNEKEIYSGDAVLVQPKVSPDGKKIVAILIDKSFTLKKPEVYLAFVENNQLQKINKPWDGLRDFSWLKDGSGLIVCGYFNKSEKSSIYKFNFADESVKPVVYESNDYYGVSITADNNTIATIQSKAVAGIWQFDLSTKRPTQISPNSQDVLGKQGLAVFQNDDLVYAKAINQDSGDLWLMKSNGSEQKQLTKNNGVSFYPLISADGNTIIFERLSNGEYDIWKMNSDGSNQIQITKTPELIETICGVSADGKTVIYSEKNVGQFVETYKQINTETGEILVFNDKEDEFWDFAQLSPNGNQIMYSSGSTDVSNPNSSKQSLNIADYDGKKISNSKKILDTINSKQYHWSADGKSIFYTESQNGNPDIWQLNLKDNQTSKVTNFNLESIYRYAVSPSGKKLYLIRGSESQEIVLIKNEEK
jgi:serine/threonine protein kinase